MKEGRNEFRKLLKVFCVFLAVLLSLLGAAGGESLPDSDGAGTGGSAINEAVTEEAPAEPAPAPEDKIPAPAAESGAAPAEKASSGKDGAESAPAAESDAEPAEKAPSGKADAEPAPASDSVAAPAEKTPAETDGGDPEEPVPEPATDSTGAPAEETDSEETGGPEEPVPDPATDPEEEAEPAEEGAPAENAETPEDEEHLDGLLRTDVPCEIELRGSSLYRLPLQRRSDLILKVSGIPVKITVTSVQNGRESVWESTAGKETGAFVISELLTLERGEYTVAIEPLRENQQGPVSVCFAVPAPEEEEPEADGATDAAPEEAQDARAAAEEEADPGAAPDGEASDVESDGAGETSAGEDASAGETAEPDSAQDTTGTADAVGSAERPSVRVTVSCGEGFQPGARVVLTAEVSDPAWQGTIRWQYSADGGATVRDVEDAEGAEYSFILDEVNSAYWWRAYLE